ncbi:aldehyde dehydrogenase [Eremomyces bilateralis CBS 781.70]|uniref:aldehyde dehydrogenase (NAD(+)) n=1 Tax=Eremomyces bilateralis CBS 781.70 TaxID=1392243 RepID=A0A6G1G3W7_9PEZI|nr:aldehyde dehydrogenase [Eremomyces bilateralis CBS 781.70]KAF1812764.1 aldehyde dehydrogenase [Eremomyces bilateralis CBS 781.70]
MAAKLITNDVPSKLFLNNEWVAGSGPSLTITNPKDSSIVTSLQEASPSDLDIAVQYATEAFESGPWSTFPALKRAECMNKLADLLEAHVEEIAYLESVASGRLLSMVRYEIPLVARVFRYYAGWADKIKGDAYPPDDGHFKFVSHVPLGVCAGITAWNASLHFLAWKSAPALATGNTVIIKPSEKSPLGSLAIGYLIAAAGFPPGVFQILPGGGALGAAISGHMRIAKVSFTGSTATGVKIQEAAARSNLKRVTLELGGKSPSIVFDDADIPSAVQWAVRGITINSGQVCAASSRLYVHESIMEPFMGALKDAFEGIGNALGEDPQQLATTFGPVIDEEQFKKIWEYIEAGKKSSAQLLTGGSKYDGNGTYIAPTIFVNPPEDSVIYKEEIFGPVLCAKSFKTEEEVLKWANDTQYGLAAAIFTKELSRALRVSSKLQAGTVSVNCALSVGPQVPMGGMKMSGSGRELGEYALRHYTEPKTTWIRLE